MVEFSRRPDGAYLRSFGGDALNVALYLARFGVPTDFASVLGDDAYSEEMLRAWQAEGIGTALVRRLPGGTAGLYVIDIDARGERSFAYWRDGSPARTLFAGQAGAAVAGQISNHDLVYLSGITLSRYDETGRGRLFAALDVVRERGGRVVFDGNYRQRLWRDPAEARDVFAAMLARTDIALPTFEDEAALFGDATPEATIARLRAHAVREIALKRGVDPCLVSLDDRVEWVPLAEAVAAVDTTAAGDSFNAAYLAARLQGLAPAAAARCGHRLANVVIRHRGAIVPRAAMPETIGDCAPGQPGRGRLRSMADILALAPVIPVLTIRNVGQAVPLARALAEGGLPVLEITLRTPGAIEAALAILAELPEAVVGLGTVLTAADLQKARQIGAAFAVSPGFHPELAQVALRTGMPWLPGVATASDVMMARGLGFTRLKFFPAEASGGPALLRALHAPFPDVLFCPTGGIGEGNLAGYLDLPNVACVGGSWLASERDIASGAWDVVRARARRVSGRG
jgi:2-dehydro-3-deoxygluconokinase